MQKAVVVWLGPIQDRIDYRQMDSDHDYILSRSGIEEVNQLLEQGWKVVSCTPMGGAGASGGETSFRSINFASIFVLEKQ